MPGMRRTNGFLPSPCAFWMKKSTKPKKSIMRTSTLQRVWLNHCERGDGRPGDAAGRGDAARPAGVHAVEVGRSARQAGGLVAGPAGLGADRVHHGPRAAGALRAHDAVPGHQAAARPVVGRALPDQVHGAAGVVGHVPPDQAARRARGRGAPGGAGWTGAAARGGSGMITGGAWPRAVCARAEGPARHSDSASAATTRARPYTGSPSSWRPPCSPPGVRAGPREQACESAEPRTTDGHCQ